jgi:WD40 repeat protein
MALAQSFDRMIRIVVAAMAILATLASPMPQAASRDLAAMSGEDIRVLQQRLLDGACYKGPIDGQPSAALETAQKFCPDQEPVLRIETGMHVAPIKRIGVDAQCKIAATGSDDKTVRLWSMPEGRLIRTQRLPIGEGNLGKIFAVAVSPDGRVIAAGGWVAHSDQRESVYFFDAATESSVRRIGAFGNVILHLAFSPDGTKLAVALGGGQGIRVLDVASGRELMADTDFAADANSNGVAFGPDGALYATGYDGFLRRYGPNLRRTAKVAAPGGKRPYDIAIDPSGRKLAVGYADTTAVDILDAVTLRRIAAADARGISEGSLNTLAWLKNGTRLIAGGEASALFGNERHAFLRSWSPDGRKAQPDVPVSDDTIQSLVPCGEFIAFAAQDPRFGLLRADGTAVTLQKGRTFDARNKLGATFTLSEDATRLRFGLGFGDDTPVVFNLTAGTLRDAPSPIAGLIEPSVTGLAVTDWQNTYNPLFKGRPIELVTNESSRSLAIVPDRSGFVLGTDFSLRAFAADGNELWNNPVPGVAFGVNLSADGQIIVAAYDDGTIRWHRWSDGQELLALFVDRLDRRWVAWTPSGYYMASPGGEDLIGWHVNRSWDQPADFFPASRFRSRFNRPDIVQTILETLDEEASVQRANGASHRREETRPIEAALPPVINIVSPGRDAAFTSPNLTLTYSVRSPSGLPVDKVEILLDGSPTGANAPGLDKNAGTKEVQQSVTIGLPAHDIDVGLIARSGTLVSEITHVKLTFRGAAPAPQEADALKPVLYALLVGVANYQNEKLRLDYSAKDAEGVAAALKTQSGGLYRDVKVKVLTDKDATATGMKDGLLWLQKETTSRDLAIVFLAGHGVTDAKNEFWFLPYEADTTRLFSTAVPRRDIVDVLRDLPGKKILFLDACHAGAVLPSGIHTRGAPVDLNSTINDFATAESGLVVYGASTGREFSIESDDWKHGAFTKALIEAIGEGKADIGHQGKITTALLDAYLAERVKELTGGEQHPVMSRPEAVPDFPLALVR